MKRTIGIFSLAMLLTNTFMPALTSANQTENINEYGPENEQNQTIEQNDASNDNQKNDKNQETDSLLVAQQENQANNEAEGQQSNEDTQTNEENQNIQTDDEEGKNQQSNVTEDTITNEENKNEDTNEENNQITNNLTAYIENTNPVTNEIKEATLIDGITFQKKVKWYVDKIERVGIGNTTYDNYYNDPSHNEQYDNEGRWDEYVNSFERGDDETTSTLLISTSDSEPVYITYDKTNGILRYHTKANKIYFNENSQSFFEGYKSIKSLDLSNFDTSKVTNFNKFLKDCTNLESINLEGWDISEIQSSSAFNGAFNSDGNLKYLGLSGWKLPGTFTGFFTNIQSVETINVTNWDLTDTTDINHLFYETKAKNIIGLETWKNTNNIEDMSYLFQNATNLENIDLSTWDTSNVSNISYMFKAAKKIENINLNGWDLSNIHCTKESTTIDCKETSGIFSETNGLKKISMSGWIIPTIFNNPIEINNNDNILDEIDVTNWNFTKNNTKSINGLFKHNKSRKIKGLNTWDISNIISMVDLFNNADYITGLNLDGWNFSSIGTGTCGIEFANGQPVLVNGEPLYDYEMTGMTNMFNDMNGLEYLSASGWVIPKIFGKVLGNASNGAGLNSEDLIINVSNWNLENAEYLGYLFSYSYAKSIIGLDTWDTSNIKDLSYMFWGAYNLQNIDLSSFKTTNLIRTTKMFSDASALNKIWITKDFNINENMITTNMFAGTTNIVGGNGTQYSGDKINGEFATADRLGASGYFTDKLYNITYNTEGGTLNNAQEQYSTFETYNLPSPIKKHYELSGWVESGTEIVYTYVGDDIKGDKEFNAEYRNLEQKMELTDSNAVILNSTEVKIGDNTIDNINNNDAIKMNTQEINGNEVSSNENKLTVKDDVIEVSTNNNIEYKGGLEVVFENTNGNEVINDNATFSTPIAIRIPVTEGNGYVKIQVKHKGDDNYSYKGLTLNPYANCTNGEVENTNDKYEGTEIAVNEKNGNKYATIYACSASTFIAYNEKAKQQNNSNVGGASGGSSTSTKATSNCNTIKSEKNTHNSADTNNSKNDNSANNKQSKINVKEQVKKVEGKLLTRGEVAVMTNILLEVYPQLTENKSLNEVSEACENYADEQNFTKDEKKAITRLCKLSIMGIHKDTKEPLEEFLSKQIATNGEFATVMDRTIANYTEKDLSVVKEALKKLENNEEGVVFGTVYDVFMSIKTIFN